MNKDTEEISMIFPTTTEKLFASLQTDSTENCKIQSIYCESVPPLSNYFEHSMTLDELQYIAVKVSTLTDDERDTLSAFLESFYSVGERTVKTVMDALENIDTYHLDKTLLSVDDVANAYIKANRETCTPLIDKMVDSTNQQERNLASYVANLEQYIDKAAYVKDITEQNDLYITSKGFLAVCWSEFFWRDDRQVPDEYRLTSTAKPSILRKLEELKANISPANPTEKSHRNDPSI